MNKRIHYLLLLFIVIHLPVRAEVQTLDSELPSLDEIRAEYIEANGGRRNMQSIHSLILSGRIILEKNGAVQEFKLYRKRPNKMRLKINFGELYAEKLFDGEKAYGRSGPVGSRGDYAELDHEQSRLMKQDSHIESLFYVLSGMPGVLRLVGVEEVDGKECYRFDITDEEKYPMRSIWLSKEDLREVKYLHDFINEEGSKVAQSIYLSDYEQCHGVWIAHKLEYLREGQKMKTIEITDVRDNVGIYDGFFEVD